MAFSLKAAILVTFLYACIGALPTSASDNSEMLTCAYTVDALTSTVDHASSHGGAYLTVLNSAGCNTTFHLVRPGVTDSTAYNFIQGDHFNFVGTGSCVSDICAISVYMDGYHSWKADYIAVSTGTQTAWFSTVPWVYEDPVSVDECSSSSVVITKHDMPRKYIRSVVSKH